MERPTVYVDFGIQEITNDAAFADGWYWTIHAYVSTLEPPSDPEGPFPNALAASAAMLMWLANNTLEV